MSEAPAHVIPSSQRSAAMAVVPAVPVVVQFREEAGASESTPTAPEPDVLRRRTGVYFQPFSNPLGTTRVPALPADRPLSQA
jgi:hypothetical protein